MVKGTISQQIGAADWQCQQSGWGGAGRESGKGAGWGSFSFLALFTELGGRAEGKQREPQLPDLPQGRRVSMNPTDDLVGALLHSLPRLLLFLLGLLLLAVLTLLFHFELLEAVCHATLFRRARPTDRSQHRVQPWVLRLLG